MSRKRIRARDIVNDIRSGMDDVSLMQKYHLSSKGLQRVFRKLLEGGFVMQADLDERPFRAEDTAEIDDMRELTRHYPVLRVTVYDGGEKGQPGTVRDITERGIGVKGIKSAPNDLKTFVVDTGKLSSFDPIRFEARCKWVGHDERADGQMVAGFEITKISEEDLAELREVIGGFTLTADTLAMMIP